jgi:hypothetical protein
MDVEEDIQLHRVWADRGCRDRGTFMFFTGFFGAELGSALMMILEEGNAGAWEDMCFRDI